MRSETRRQRYEQKSLIAQTLPVSLVTTNFDFDDNLAFVIRTATCYGARKVYVIGSIPPRANLRAKSGSTVDYVEMQSFPNPNMFLQYARLNNLQLVSAELSENSVSLYDYKFNFQKETAIILGHESLGVPVEIAINSDNVYIPMLGSGFSLNTSQAGTAFINEYARQYICGEGK